MTLIVDDVQPGNASSELAGSLRGAPGQAPVQRVLGNVLQMKEM